MEDIATWRGDGNIVSDADPNYSDSELYKDQKRLSKTDNYKLLANKSTPRARNFHAGSSFTDLASCSTPKVGEQQGSLPSGSVLCDTTQCPEPLFPLSPDPNNY